MTDNINERNLQVKTPADIYNLAFDAHFGLVSVHSVADDNGRSSRLLMNYILAYHNLPLAIIFKEDKKEYFEALEASRAAEPINLTPFRNFIYSQQIKFLNNEIALFEKGVKMMNIVP